LSYTPANGDREPREIRLVRQRRIPARQKKGIRATDAKEVGVGEPR